MEASTPRWKNLSTIPILYKSKTCNCDSLGLAYTGGKDPRSGIAQWVFLWMPQGVEQNGIYETRLEKTDVVFPLMPQGVEHRYEDAQGVNAFVGGFFVDAARR